MKFFLGLSVIVLRDSIMFSTLHLTSAITDLDSPLDAEMTALSIPSPPLDNVGKFVMDPLAAEMIQRHERQQCGSLGKRFKQALKKPLLFLKSPIGKVTIKYVCKPPLIKSRK